jgi:hypothetical protein
MFTKRTRLRVLHGTVSLVFSAALALAQTKPPGAQVPKITGRTLDDQEITLPDAASGRVTLLLLGASKKGGDRTKLWKDHFLGDFASEPSATYYVVALLERAPSMFRGMIRNGMRSGTPVTQRAHVLTCVSGENDLLKYFDLTDDSLPVVLLLDRSGYSLWVYKGQYDDSQYQALRAAIQTSLGRK